MKNIIDLKKIDGLLWDIDGVLIDESKSYREAIRRTVSYFLKSEVSTKEVDEIKNIVGLNNDWDASYALLLKKTRKNFNVREFVENISENRKTTMFNKVFEVFQNYYLGENGLINQERLMVSINVLIALKSKYKKMGIVTGRPKFEADYALRINRIENLFDDAVVMEDTRKGKPFADPINLAMKNLNLKNTLYIGDSPSDVAASKAAGIPCLFIGEQKLGDMNFKNISNLVDYLL